MSNTIYSKWYISIKFLCLIFSMNIPMMFVCYLLYLLEVGIFVIACYIIPMLAVYSLANLGFGRFAFEESTLKLQKGVFVKTIPYDKIIQVEYSPCPSVDKAYIISIIYNLNNKNKECKILYNDPGAFVAIVKNNFPEIPIHIYMKSGFLL